MYYIFANIKTFARREKLIFALYILCIAMSVIVINFVFGFYHHLQQKKLDNINDTDELDVGVDDSEQTYVTVEKLINVCKSMDADVLKNCNICLSIRFQEDVTDVSSIDNSLLAECVYFRLENGELKNASEIGERMDQNGILIDGSYFTSKQFENGEMVCLASALDPDSYVTDEETALIKKYRESADGTCTVDGKTYTVIGHVEWFSYMPMVPLTTLDGDESVREIGFDFSDPLTMEKYNAIKDALTKAFGDKVEVPELELAESDSQSFYSILILTCVLLGLYSGILLAMLYEYILLQRRKTLTIYRLCGLTRRRAVFLYVFESLILTVVTYAVSACSYAKLLLPWLSEFFEYIAESYSITIYMKIGTIYTVSVMAVLCVIIVAQIRKNIVRNLKGV